MGVPGTPHKIATVRAHWPWVSSSSSYVSLYLRQNNAAYLFTCKVVAILILVLIYIVVSANAAAAAMTVVKAQSRPAVLVVHLQYTFDDRGAAQSVSQCSGCEVLSGASHLPTNHTVGMSWPHLPRIR